MSQDEADRVDVEALRRRMAALDKPPGQYVMFIHPNHEPLVRQLFNVADDKPLPSHIRVFEALRPAPKDTGWIGNKPFDSSVLPR